MSSKSKDEKREESEKDRKVRRKLKRDPESNSGSSEKKESTVKTQKVKASSSSSSTASKIAKPDIKRQNAREIFYYEEEEAPTRDPLEDMKIQKAACDEIRSMVAEIKKYKESGKSVEAEDARINAVLQFITLKKMNRMAHMRCKKVRDNTSKAKQEIDKHHLKLQNLLYEVMHLQKEINKCLQFKSKDEDINLVEVDEFYEEAPEEISKPSVTKKDLHQQTLARLDWELEQRTRLADKYKVSQETKEKVCQEIREKREYLESLQPKLNTILQATKPVQEYLGMPFDETREQYKTAVYLPRPLYVLYMQASAFQDACDKKLSVNIQGDSDVAKALEDSAADVDDDSDSDQEDQDKKRKRRRRSSDRQTVAKQRLLKKHPLSIQLDVTCEDDSTLQLTFFYMMSLHIVTVNVKVQMNETISQSISGGDLLNPDTLLGNLYPKDLGNDTPNAANAFTLTKAGLRDFSSYVKEVGRPYVWAQRLAGLQFLKDSHDPPRVDTDVSAVYMEETILEMRKRFNARLALQKQLSALERCSVSVSKEYQEMFPAKISSRLVKWSKSTYEDFEACKYSKPLLDSELASQVDIYYTGTIERGSAKMQFSVVVPPNYPNSTPLFAVNIIWKSERFGLVDENVRDLEAEVNMFHEDLMLEGSHDHILTNQIQRLLMCFDVYLETETDDISHEGPNEFSREKVYPRISRGPQRSRPYKFNSQLGFFTQR